MLYKVYISLVIGLILTDIVCIVAFKLLFKKVPQPFGLP